MSPSALTKENVEDALTLVFDPEIHVDIVTMGLIYGVEILENKNVKVTMTMTTVACPYAPQLLKDVEEAVKEAGAHEVEIDVVFDPPWKPTPELRAMLGV
ncbi:MAG: metal-sulfur cluster assembly factor [Candidatus Doudnabacteria bacterium]|nr:metal-sulfur cluster assembly factor [Candidatus Doudnabacteria bacterium]